MLSILFALGLLQPLQEPRPAPPIERISKLHASTEWSDCIDDHVGNLDEDEAADVCAEELE